MGPFEIGTLLSSLKTAGELAKAMVDVRDATTFQAKAFELTREIIAAQQAAISTQAEQLALLQEVRDLRQRIDELEAWSNEMLRYELVVHSTGVLTRRLRSGMANGEHTHDLCIQCFELKKKGYLQPLGSGRVRCMSCAEELSLEPSQPRQIRYGNRGIF